MQLNLAEGWGRGRHAKAGKNHFRIARGSASEAFAVMQLVGGHEAMENDLRRIWSMRVGLARCGSASQPRADPVEVAPQLGLDVRDTTHGI